MDTTPLLEQLERDLPATPITRVRTFIYDLALCASYGLSDTTFTVLIMPGRIEWNLTFISGNREVVDIVRRRLHEKWNGRVGAFQLMVTLGYLDEIRSGNKSQGAQYRLTQRAFDLLERPATTQRVFISYRRQTSSALALLVEARLKLADPTLDVFIDKDIPVGKDWAQELRERVEASDYFVLLISAETLDSVYVRDEIAWAVSAGVRLISILHPAVDLATLGADDPAVRAGVDQLDDLQLIRIDSASAAHLDAAIRLLLNTLGYSTL